MFKESIKTMIIIIKKIFLMVIETKPGPLDLGPNILMKD